jgi:hypothetical protein
VPKLLRRHTVRTVTIFSTLLLSASAYAQVRVEVGIPEPPHVVVSAPAPRVVVAPPPARRVVVAPPPPARVVVQAPPPPRVVVQAPPPPVVRFEAPPPLVVVEPGIQVVADSDEEVFFVDGYYWHPGPDGTWWRTRDHRGGWVVAPPRVVPAAIVRLPRGHYRHWRGEERHEEHRIEKAERREEKAERREEHEERKFEKHHGH